MKNSFLKANELSLNPAGYLINTTSKEPVTHPEFVRQQKNADYIVKLAAACEGKNFKQVKIDNFAAIKSEVLSAINAATTVTYVSTPSKPVSAVNDELVKYALDFDAYLESKGESEKINQIMNEYNKIFEVETVGEYFQEGLVKLAKIYTIAEIQAAVVAVSALVD